MNEINNWEAKLLLDAVIDVPNFPKPGIIYKDITEILNNKFLFRVLNDHLVQRYTHAKLDLIVGIESRGFIFGAALAALLQVGFVPIRKRGKLPREVTSEEYSLEYGTDTLEMHVDAFKQFSKPRVLLIDDIIASGGTAKAATKLIKQNGGECVEACFVLGLSFLDGHKQLASVVPTYSVITV